MFVQSIIGVICRWDMLALFARVDIFNVNFFLNISLHGYI